MSVLVELITLDGAIPPVLGAGRRLFPAHRARTGLEPPAAGQTGTAVLTPYRRAVR